MGTIPQPNPSAAERARLPRTPDEARSAGDVVFDFGSPGDPVRVSAPPTLEFGHRRSVSETLDWAINAAPNEQAVRPSAEWHDETGEEARAIARRELVRLGAGAHRGRL